MYRILALGLIGGRWLMLTSVGRTMLSLVYSRYPAELMTVPAS